MTATQEVDIRAAAAAFFAGEKLGNRMDQARRQQLEAILRQVLLRDYKGASQSLRDSTLLSSQQKAEVKSATNVFHLAPLALEWTSHGITKSFRYWDREEKVAYLELARELVRSLKDLSPYVSFGFGAVLGMMRGDPFIPHDDDLDLLIAFHASGGDTFSVALASIAEHVSARGFELHGDLPSHRNINRNGGTAVDVFVGFIEDHHVSWFPSHRRSLLFDDVFPAREVDLYGVPCDIPRNPEAYLEATYGQQWRQPTAEFNHPWNLQEYKDFI